jgi:prefoldin alpha subunit
MVPMTSSLYVPGKLKDTNSLVIDIGTGYFVEKDRKEAIEYFQRKIEFIGKQMETIQGYLKQKYMAKQKVDETLQVKIQQLQAQQKAVEAGKS